MKTVSGTLLALIAALSVNAVEAATVAYSAVTASSGINAPEYAHDGVFPVEWTGWTNTTAYWSGTAEYLIYEFDQLYSLTHYDVSLDNNDSYQIQFSLDGVNWGLTGNSSDVNIGSNDGNVGWGMDTFSADMGPLFARYARVMAVGGDNMYSVGELQFSGVAAVPEPETYALMLAGLGLVGFAARKRHSV